MDGKTDDGQAENRNGLHGQQKEIGKKVKRLANPLLEIHCIREPYCEYPVAVRVTMDDGTIQTYELKNKMEYKFGEVLKALDKLTVGYQYNGRHEKSRVHNGQL